MSSDFSSLGNKIRTTATGIASGQNIKFLTPISGTTAQFTSITASVNGNITGNAFTATKLQTARNLTTIGDVLVTINSFDGSSNVSGIATIDSGRIVNSHIKATANISDTKLATISTPGKVSNSATTATNTNTINAIVARDASGNFSAGTITANLDGNSSTASKLQTSRTISSTGDIVWSVSFDGSGNATGTAAIGTGVIVNSDISNTAGIVDTKLATISTAGKVVNSATTATSNNTANAIVARDASGNFSAGTITANLYGNASTVTNGVYTIGNQTINGLKAFTSDITVHGLTVGKGNNSFEGNTAFGEEALLSVVEIASGEAGFTSSGFRNTAVGYRTLKNNELGKSNVAIGYQAISAQQNPYYNTAVGSHVFWKLSEGQSNTGLGCFAGYNLVTGSNNLFLGDQAGYSETNLSNTIIFSAGGSLERMRIDSSGNASIGSTNSYGFKLYVESSFKSPTVVADYFMGDGSFITNIDPSSIGSGIIPVANLPSTIVYQDTTQTISGVKTFSNDITVGSNKIGKGNANSTNVSFGLGNYSAYPSYSIANYNVSLGYYSHRGLYSGAYNVALGAYSGYSLYNGNGNITLGYYSGFSLSSEYYNVALGYEAMRNIRGSYNIALGFYALKSTAQYTSSDYNVAIGAFAGQSLQGSSDNNVFIGPYAGSGETSLNNTIIFSAGSGLERMRIDSNGNVGIGIAPTNGIKLYVSGAISSTGDLYTPYVEADNIVCNFDLMVDGVISGQGTGLYNINGSSINNGTISNSKLQSSTITFGSTSVSLGSTIEIGSGLSAIVNGATNNLYLDVNLGNILVANTDQTITSVKTFNEQVKLKQGTTSSLSLTCNTDQNTGLYFPGNDTIGIVQGGTEKFRFNNGSLGVNTNNPLAALHVNNGSITFHRDTEADLLLQAGDAHLQIASSDAGSYASALLLTNGSKHWALHHKTGTPSVLEFRSHTTTSDGDFLSASTNRMTLNSSGDLWIGGTFTEASTRKIKENIKPLTSQLQKILKLNPVSYQRINSSTNKEEIGFISEEVQEVYPEFVNGEGVNYSKMVSILVSAVKELSEKVEQQDKIIKELLAK